MKKLFLIGALIFLGGLLLWQTPLLDWLRPEGLEKFRSFILQKGSWAPVCFVILYVLLTTFMFPSSFFHISAGFLFGVGWGIFYNLISATISMMVSFFLGRFLGKEWVERLLGHHAFFKKWLEKSRLFDFRSVFVIRVTPFFTFSFLNYAFGITSVGFPQYIVGSFLGVFPTIYALTALGHAGLHADLKDLSTFKNPQVWGAFLAVFFVAFVPRLVISLFKKEETFPS